MNNTSHQYKETTTNDDQTTRKRKKEEVGKEKPYSNSFLSFLQHYSDFKNNLACKVESSKYSGRKRSKYKTNYVVVKTKTHIDLQAKPMAVNNRLVDASTQYNAKEKSDATNNMEEIPKSDVFGYIPCNFCLMSFENEKNFLEHQKKAHPRIYKIIEPKIALNQEKLADDFSAKQNGEVKNTTPEVSSIESSLEEDNNIINKKMIYNETGKTEPSPSVSFVQSQSEQNDKIDLIETEKSAEVENKIEKKPLFSTDDDELESQSDQNDKIDLIETEKSPKGENKTKPLFSTDDDELETLYSTLVGDDVDQSSENKSLFTDQSVSAEIKETNLNVDANTDTDMLIEYLPEEDIIEEEVPQVTFRIEALYSCSDCCIHFPTDRALLTHMKVEHRGYTKKCDECKKIYQTDAELTAHIVRAHKQIYCHVCKCYVKRIMYESHVRKHTNPNGQYINSVNLVCGFCSTRFQSKEKLEHHLKYHTFGTEHFCKICNCDFETVDSLLTHLNTANTHSIFENIWKDNQKVYKFKCNLCKWDNLFNKLYDLAKHCRNHHNVTRISHLISNTLLIYEKHQKSKYDFSHFENVNNE